MPPRRTVEEIKALLEQCPVGDLPKLISRLARDERAGVRALARAARARLAKQAAEAARLEDLMAMQAALHAQGLRVVAGLDEVGRGALAGPVSACAVVMRVETTIDGLDDSKRLLRAKREVVAAEVLRRAVAVSVAHASSEEIDALGIVGATRLAWRRALDGLAVEVDHVLVDGLDGECGRPSTAVVRGDSRVAAIAAASCVAKVERDALMVVLARAHPGYLFEENRGYGTPEHLAAIAALGLSPIHRRSFAPCSQQSLFGEEPDVADPEP